EDLQASIILDSTTLGNSQKKYPLLLLPQIHRLNLFIICESVAVYFFQLP
ncbi:MAG: hypothetical protein CG441_1292, partial [Methylococcaceae bacterium NSM2-1]